MGYRIQYDPEQNKKYPSKVRAIKQKYLLLTAVMIAGFVLGVLGIKNSNALKRMLLPGDPQVTESAFNAMVTDIRAGESVGDAVTAFCLEIMKHGKIK